MRDIPLDEEESASGRWFARWSAALSTCTVQYKAFCPSVRGVRCLYIERAVDACNDC